MKSNDNRLDKIILPLPPANADAKMEMEIYARFMRHLRCVPSPRFEIKILQAVQFTADILDASEELVCKVLVDLGLRAPRYAFPVSFLHYADTAMQRTDFEIGSATESLKSLNSHWSRPGMQEEKLVSHSTGMPRLGIPANTSVKPVSKGSTSR